jgi:hypothetical protein
VRRFQEMISVHVADEDGVDLFQAQPLAHQFNGPVEE